MFFDQNKTDMSKIYKIAIGYAVIIISIIAYIMMHLSPIRLAKGVYVTNPKPIADFKLIDNQGHEFNEKNLKKHWSLLYFGFSSCGTVCPVTLQVLNQTYERLPKSKRPQVILVSVDPQHDSIQRLNQYVHRFNKNFFALSGPMSKINALQQQLHVTVSREPMSHGTEIVLINPKAEIQAYFYFPITVEVLSSDLKKILAINQ